MERLKETPIDAESDRIMSVFGSELEYVSFPSALISSCRVLSVCTPGTVRHGLENALTGSINLNVNILFVSS